VILQPIHKNFKIKILFIYYTGTQLLVAYKKWL